MTQFSCKTVPDDRLIAFPYNFQPASSEHVRNCFAYIHAQSEKAYHGDGVWADRDSAGLAKLPPAGRPLNIIDRKFPPLYRNTAWRMIGYAHAYRADAQKIYLDRLLAGGEY
ncbi:MAG: hypothetical protein PHV82_11125, partial [Victivallaceae bacterium]|nr:hypothetical protein [Victivallaceae bacterium]